MSTGVVVAIVLVVVFVIEDDKIPSSVAVLLGTLGVNVACVGEVDDGLADCLASGRYIICVEFLGKGSRKEEGQCGEKDC